MSETNNNRRSFIKQSATAIAATSAISSVAAAQTQTDANSKIRIGFIGPGGRGFNAHVRTLSKLQLQGQPIELVAVCDVYSKNRERAAHYIEKETGQAPQQYVDYIPERPQVTRNSKLKEERIATQKVNSTDAHFKNWIEAMVAGDPAMCNNDPLLGAAAITTVILGAKSYREGKVFFFDDETHTVKEADSSWATRWEKRSAERGKPNHIAGWNAGDAGSVLEEPSHMKLAGPWVDGKDPSDS